MLKDMLDGIGALTLAEKMALLGYSKLATEVWSDYVSDMLSGASLRACAELCGVSLKTSWFMRMRLCEVMARTQPFRTGGSVSWRVDGAYLSESLKGNRSRSAAGMPRGAHRHGSAVRERGISSLKACVGCMRGKRPGRLVLQARRARQAHRRRARGGAGGAGGLRARAHRRALGLRARTARAGRAAHDAAPASEAAGSLDMANALHQRLKQFLGRFVGVSTRRLGHYLAWFGWAEHTSSNPAGRPPAGGGRGRLGCLGQARPRGPRGLRGAR